MNNFIQTFGADKNTLTPLFIQDTTNGQEEKFEFTSGIQNTVVQNITPNISQETKEQSHVVCPPDITPEQAEKFTKLGLTYELVPEGHYLCVYEDPETHQISKFIYHPQAWVNAHAPENVTWEKDGIVSHVLQNESTVWHFEKTKGGLTKYIQNTLTPNNLKLANRDITRKLASIFKGDMHTAFGIDLTSFSLVDGHLRGDNVGYYAGLRLDEGYLNVDHGEAWFFDEGEHGGLGLFLQVTSSGS